MRLKILIVFIIIVLCSCSRLNVTKVAKLYEFESITIGDTVESFMGYSINKKEVRHNYPKGNFYIHFVNDTLPAIALNEEFGNISTVVTSRGGVLIGGSDGKYAASFGLRYKFKKQWNGNYKYYLAESLAVCTDQDAKIIAIYKNVKKSDLEFIVNDIKGKY